MQHNSDPNPVLERSVPIEPDNTTPEGNEQATGWLGRIRGTGGSSTSSVTVFAVCNAP